MITEVIGIIPEQSDTVVFKQIKPHKPDRPPRDTTEVDDTARIPISFDVSVDDWDEINVDL